MFYNNGVAMVPPRAIQVEYILQSILLTSIQNWQTVKHSIFCELLLLTLASPSPSYFFFIAGRNCFNSSGSSLERCASKDFYIKKKSAIIGLGSN